MESLLLGLALLACPVGMGVMMWMMNRGQRNHADHTTAQGPPGQEQVAQLRAEIDQLKAERATQRAQGGQ